ncbi:SLC13 family permease [Georgenia yuyongxinii]|uniref:SLC13 family permease n=1 Tax=Georgenia yuyongxinii TaxID=2589797 RepID=UPI002ED993AD
MTGPDRTESRDGHGSRCHQPRGAGRGGGAVPVEPAAGERGRRRHRAVFVPHRGAGRRAALAGFGDPIVVFVASLLVISEALDATGVTTWAGRALTDRAGTGVRSLLVAVMVLAGVLTAVVSPNGSVAALRPMVVVVAVRGGHPPSHMVMPLAFAAHAGSVLALSGRTE